jgi:propionyl-CoA carboxylase alpha chain
MEVRVYAEDPANNFLPDIGKLVQYVRPQGAGVRVDDGFEEGMDIPIYYDPMIAKLITWGKDREEAIERMIRAIDEYTIVGCQTTLSFCNYVMKHEAFRSGNFDTNFVKHYFTPSVLNEAATEDEMFAASIVANELQKVIGSNNNNGFQTEQSTISKWKINRL